MLVVGVAGTAFGREQRAARMFAGMLRIRPFMLLSKWGDGSARRLMEEHGLAYAELPFGYLGRARLRWTLVTLVHLPSLTARMVWTYWRERCRGVVILNAFSVLNALLPLLFLRYVLGAKIVFYLGDSPGPGGLSRLVAWLLGRLRDWVIVNSEVGRKAWMEAGVPEAAMRVIYNGVDLDHFKPTANRPKDGDPSSRTRGPRVGFVGQLREAKGIWDFIRMADIVARALPDVEFVVAGPVEPANPEHRRLTACTETGPLKGRLRLVGRVERVEEFMSQMDILVVPSRYADPAPNVCLEAMASGLPVIATLMGGIPELVANQETGLLVPPGEPEALADAVLRLARDTALRGRMGAAGRLRAETRFDVVVNAREVEEAILTA
jgi:glycosyltransferase involved in cell wall biosynthesis